MELLPDIDNKVNPEILLAMAELQQPRTPFQIENFVINQHETPEMQYYQCVLELQSLYYTIKTVNIEIKKSELMIKKLRDTGDELDELDAQLKEVGLEQTRMVGLGAIREFEYLVNKFESFPHKYTREELHEAQLEYWSIRLNRQSILEAVGGSQAQASHLEALRQMGALEIKEGHVVPTKIELKVPEPVSAFEPLPIE